VLYRKDENSLECSLRLKLIMTDTEEVESLSPSTDVENQPSQPSKGPP
jgi:hypothetical protein